MADTDNEQEDPPPLVTPQNAAAWNAGQLTGAALVGTAPAQGGDLNNIVRCLRSRPALPAKADTTAMLQTLTGSATGVVASVTMLIAMLSDPSKIWLLWIPILLIVIASVTGFNAVRKFLDARKAHEAALGAKDVHLEAAIVYAEQLKTWAANHQTHLNETLAARIVEQRLRVEDEKADTVNAEESPVPPAPTAGAKKT